MKNDFDDPTSRLNVAAKKSISGIKNVTTRIQKLRKNSRKKMWNRIAQNYLTKGALYMSRDSRRRGGGEGGRRSKVSSN